MISVKHIDIKHPARFVHLLAIIPILWTLLSLIICEGRLWPAIGAVATGVGFLAAWQVSRRGVNTEAAGGDPPKDSLNTRLRKLTTATQIIADLGPNSDLAATKQTMVEAGCVALDAELVALFTIDPCTGHIETECTKGVSESLQQAFLNLFGQQLTDRGERHAWVVTDAANIETQDEESLQVLADCGISTILACPIRSEASAAGAIVGFYTSALPQPEDRIYAIEALSAQASTALSYSLSLEQSRFLLDDLAGANQELSVQATVDGLTGLPNHRTFQQALTDLCRKSLSKNGRPFCVVMVDVDHFKIYNDTYGHREGDAVLQKVSKTMSAGLRQGDLAARYGGEEFAMIFQRADKEAAFVAADRIRRSIAEQSLRKGIATVSMGVAEFPIDATTPGELIERADKALYHAKATGRNRVFVWGTMGTSTTQASGERDESRDRAVLVVEQAEEASAGLVGKTLSSDSCSVQEVSSIAEATVLLKTRVFDIALVSAEVLPGHDTTSLSSLAAIHPHMPIVLLTGDLPAQESREALRSGATDILLKPYNPAELPVVIERNLERKHLELQRLMQKSTGVMLQAIEALVAAIDAKDHHTGGHSQGVTALSVALCDELRISNEERYALELAAKLHDIGKVALPDTALNKQSPLTEDEWQAMREHPAIGAKIVGAISELAYVSTVIRHHHERLDGSGYPDGLSGQAIPYLSRVIAVADAYEAMTSERAHRSRLTPTEAIAELQRNSGTYYQPEVVDVLERQLVAQGEITNPSTDRKAA